MPKHAANFPLAFDYAAHGRGARVRVVDYVGQGSELLAVLAQADCVRWRSLHHARGFYHRAPRYSLGEEAYRLLPWPEYESKNVLVHEFAFLLI